MTVIDSCQVLSVFINTLMHIQDCEVSICTGAGT